MIDKMIENFCAKKDRDLTSDPFIKNDRRSSSDRQKSIAIVIERSMIVRS